MSGLFSRKKENIEINIDVLIAKLGKFRERRNYLIDLIKQKKEESDEYRKNNNPFFTNLNRLINNFESEKQDLDKRIKELENQINERRPLDDKQKIDVKDAVKML